MVVTPCDRFWSIYEQLTSCYQKWCRLGGCSRSAGDKRCTGIIPLWQHRRVRCLDTLDPANGQSLWQPTHIDIDKLTYGLNG